MITVSNIIVVQGTGTYVDESVLEVTYTLASDQTGDTFDMQAKLILQNSHPTPMQAYLANFSNPTVVQIGVSPGTFKLLIRVPMTLTQGGINPPFANYTNELIVQVRAQSRLNPTETSAWA
jgi:hypothetical protein